MCFRLLMLLRHLFFFFFFFNDTATTEIYTLSLHDALPISENLILGGPHAALEQAQALAARQGAHATRLRVQVARSEEHTSELQSQSNLVCRLLLEKKKKRNKKETSNSSKILEYHEIRAQNGSPT